MKFKSPIYTQVSGSIGGLTYAHNKGGMYCRGRGLPTNPNTARQQLMRSVMTNLVMAWEALTVLQRTSWDTYAANVTVMGKLGDPIYISGQNHFIRSNAPRMQVTQTTMGFAVPITLATIVTAPTIYNTGPGPVSNTGMTFSTGDIDMVFTLGSAAPVAGVMLLYIGLPQNDGKTFYKAPYQLAATTPVAGAATTGDFAAIDSTDDELWMTNVVPAFGMNLPVRARITYVDGRLSEDYREVITVAN